MSSKRNLIGLIVEGEQKKVEWLKTWLLITFSKKSTILIQSNWYSSNIDYSWDEYFHQVSWRLDNNCDFLLITKFWAILLFFCSPCNLKNDNKIEKLRYVLFDFIIHMESNGPILDIFLEIFIKIIKTG